MTTKDEQVKILSSEILISKKEKNKLKEQDLEIAMLKSRVIKLRQVIVKGDSEDPNKNILLINNHESESKSGIKLAHCGIVLSNSSSKISNNSESKSNISEIAASKSQGSSKIFMKKDVSNDGSNISTPSKVSKCLVYTKKTNKI